MSILSGYKKVKNYIETGSGKKLLSRWTSSNTVEFNDGKTAQTKVGTIKGITTSTSATETGYAADATTVAALNQSFANNTFIRKGTADNITYGCYQIGVYSISPNVVGHPLPGYSGFMLVMSDNSISRIVKVLFLANSYTYIMSQETGTGTVKQAWTLIHGA